MAFDIGSKCTSGRSGGLGDPHLTLPLDRRPKHLRDPREERWPDVTVPLLALRNRDGASDFHLVPIRCKKNRQFEREEGFGPLLAIRELEIPEPDAFLEAAIDYANSHLSGNLGASILMHPSTIRQIGRRRLESHITNLKYGQVAINAWTGLNYQLVQLPWGAFPSGTLEEPGSGIGFVHNTSMFDRPQRSVVWAPFWRFPNGVLSRDRAFLPRPPWFITHKTQRTLGRQLAMYEYGHRSWRLPGILWQSMLG